MREKHQELQTQGGEVPMSVYNIKIQALMSLIENQKRSTPQGNMILTQGEGWK